MHTILLAGALAAAALGIGQVLRGLYRTIRKIIQVQELVEKELKNNGGSSLKDAVDRIESRLIRVENRLDRVERQRT